MISQSVVNGILASIAYARTHEFLPRFQFSLTKTITSTETSFCKSSFVATIVAMLRFVPTIAVAALAALASPIVASLVDEKVSFLALVIVQMTLICTR